MATNPNEEVPEPTLGEQVAEVAYRAGEVVRSNALLVAFLAGEFIGFILGRL
jgi:hypothetical protein